MNRRLALLLLICFTCSSRLVAQDRAQADKESCRQFTQAFYSWYVGKVFESFDHKNTDALLEALGYKGQPFSRELVQGIRSVRTEEKKSHEAILDFDPILNTQPCRALPSTRGDGTQWPVLGGDLWDLERATYGTWRRAASCRRADAHAGSLDVHQLPLSQQCLSCE